jgi:hypothetical protein
MAKTKKHTKLQKRDWAIIILFGLIIATNWTWYQVAKTNELSQRNDSSSWLIDQVQINKLKACIDEGTRPCDINPQIQQ